MFIILPTLPSSNVPRVLQPPLPPASNIFRRCFRQTSRSLGEWAGRFAEVDDDVPPLGSGSGVSHVSTSSTAVMLFLCRDKCPRLGIRALSSVTEEMGFSVLLVQTRFADFEYTEEVEQPRFRGRKSCGGCTFKNNQSFARANLDRRRE